MPDANLATLLAFFKAMANESRLRIVGLLAERPRSVQELAELLGLKEPTVSHHLAALKALGLISVRAEGVTRWHSLRHDALTRLNRILLEPSGVAALGREVAPETWESKVLGSFIDADGALTAIPASRRKRWIILKWLAEQFETGRAYPEAEVNALLQRRHWDCATLRREMVGYGMMMRESGIYRRLPRGMWREETGRRP
jgi:hypothetical protein